LLLYYTIFSQQYCQLIRRLKTHIIIPSYICPIASTALALRSLTALAFMLIVFDRGTKEIGGTLIELKSKEGQRIMIDAGYPLLLKRVKRKLISDCQREYSIILKKEVQSVVKSGKKYTPVFQYTKTFIPHMIYIFYI